jgi:hypothetical protein
VERQAQLVTQARARLLDDLAYDGPRPLWEVPGRLNRDGADWLPDERIDRAREVVFGLIERGLVELRYADPQPVGAPLIGIDVARLRDDARPWLPPDDHDSLSVIVCETDQPRLAAAAEARLARRRRLLFVELRLAVTVGLLFAVVAYLVQRDLSSSILLFILPLVMCAPAVWRFRRDHSRLVRRRTQPNGQPGEPQRPNNHDAAR